MNSSLEQLETLFNEAIGLSGPARTAFLDRACHGSAELRGRIERLLHASNAAGGFLDTAIVPGLADVAPGAKIGRYKLLEKIGEGGVGIVFMAEQEEPVRRRVALKVIKPGMDSREVIARFESERQALALMDHPNIARVLDAGTTDHGRPFFVMELVRGIKITDYCDQNLLSTEERLKLFLPVCSAIQHAHQKGIIHRDIKPSNTLVTLHDGQPVPKVIDFGIAKATQGKLTDKTLFTPFAQFIGTPAYMSPEQAEMSGLDVDTRSDVYSLGVLLYELLTGRTPFDAKELSSAGLDEVRKKIREVEPPRLTVRLNTLDDEALTIAARNRRVEALHLLAEIRGDLEWIVSRCLEKDRARRYETANALAMDVQRHLRNEPVVARPPSTAYRVQKAIARNKLAFAAAAAVTVSLVGGLAFSTVSFLREKSARQRAVAAEQAQSALRVQAELGEKRAAAEALRSAKIVHALGDVVAGIGPRVALGRKSVRDFLEQTEKRVNAELQNQPDVLAAMHDTLGRVYFDIGDYDHAVELHRAAWSARRTLLGERHADTASSLHNLGVALWRQESHDEAEKVLTQVLEIRRELFGHENADVAATVFHLSRVMHDQKRDEESLRLRREALAIYRKIYGAEHPDVAEVLSSLGNTLCHLGRFEEGEPLFRQALAMQRKLLGPVHPDLADTLTPFAQALSQHGPDALAEAVVLLREALTIERKVLEPGHPQTMRTLRYLAEYLGKQNQFSEAEIYAREWLAEMRHANKPYPTGLSRMTQLLQQAVRQQGKTPTTALFAPHWEAIEKKRAALGIDAPEVLVAMRDLADIYDASGLFVEALALAEETLARQRRVLGVENVTTLQTMETMGRLYLSLRRPHEASVILEEAIASLRPNLESNAVLASALYAHLASAYRYSGELTKAREAAQEAVARSNAQSVANRRWTLGLVLLTQKEFAAAEVEIRFASEYFKRTDPKGYTRFFCEGYLGLAFAGQGRIDEAEPMMVNGYQGLLEQRARVRSTVWRYVEELGDRLVEFFESTGRPEKAAEWKAKVDAATVSPAAAR